MASAGPAVAAALIPVEAKSPAPIVTGVPAEKMRPGYGGLVGSLEFAGKSRAATAGHTNASSAAAAGGVHTFVRFGKLKKLRQKTKRRSAREARLPSDQIGSASTIPPHADGIEGGDSACHIPITGNMSFEHFTIQKVLAAKHPEKAPMHRRKVQRLKLKLKARG